MNKMYFIKYMTENILIIRIIEFIFTEMLKKLTKNALKIYLMNGNHNNKYQ